MMSNVEIVAAFYHATDDSERRALLDPRVEWTQNEGFPGGGRHRGVDAVLGVAFAEVDRRWSGWRAEVSELIDAGPTVVAIGRYHAASRTTGQPVSAAFAHVYAVTAGRITQFRQFTDTARLVDGQSS
jgi:ketosteroid isomerase-like protein